MQTLQYFKLINSILMLPLCKSIFSCQFYYSPSTKKSYKMKQRCNTTRYFVGISLSCFKGRTYLSCSWSIHTRLFSKIQKNYRCFAQLFNKNSLYQPKIWEQMFSSFTLRLNLSFTSRRSQQQHPNDLLFPILN